MDKQLTDYIQAQLAQGISKEKIIDDLLANKWERRVIDEAFSSLASTSTNPASASNEPAPVEQATLTQDAQVATSGSNYKLPTAISEAVAALKLNSAAALLSLVLSVISSIAIFSLPGTQFKYDFSDGSSPFKNPARLLTVTLLYFTIYAVLISFINLMVSISVYDGADKKKTTIGVAASRAGKLLLRYVRASLLLIALVLGPTIVGLTVSVLLTILFSPIGAGAIGALLTVLVSLASVVWIFIALFRYALLLSVAIFEPDIPIMETPKRSRTLLQNGGYEFLILGILLYFGVTIVLGLIVGLSGIEKTRVGEVVSNIVQTALSLVVQATVIVFYRNRKTVRG